MRRWSKIDCDDPSGWLPFFFFASYNKTHSETKTQGSRVVRNNIRVKRKRKIHKRGPWRQFRSFLVLSLSCYASFASSTIPLIQPSHHTHISLSLSLFCFLALVSESRFSNNKNFSSFFGVRMFIDLILKRFSSRSERLKGNLTAHVATKYLQVMFSIQLLLFTLTGALLGI